jgi:hypothetical protein
VSLEADGGADTGGIDKWLDLAFPDGRPSIGDYGRQGAVTLFPQR